MPTNDFMQPSAHKKSQHPLAAFTLIELLVVIAIIAILAAMLLPALNGNVFSVMSSAIVTMVCL